MPLRPAEIESLRGRDWSGDPQVPAAADLVTLINGHPFLAHRAGGGCLYLDPESSLCRLEQRFGHAAKPIGCRVFPLNLVSVLPGEVSASVRFDCPAVQQGQGRKLEEQREALAGQVKEIGLLGSIRPQVLAGLEPATVLRLAAWFDELAAVADDAESPPGFGAPGAGMLAMLLAVRHLARLGPEFLNDRETLDEILPALSERFRGKAVALLQGPGWVTSSDRALFRLWLAGYLRRDEVMIGRGPVARLGRTWALARLFCGVGRWRDLGEEHADAPLRRAGPFAVGTRGMAVAGTGMASWDAWRRLRRARLLSLQFCGSALYGTDFFTGAASWCGAALLVRAAAGIQAAASGRVGAPSAADVEYATGVIDHSFGRSALLRSWHQRHIEARFLEPLRFAALLRIL